MRGKRNMSVLFCFHLVFILYVVLPAFLPWHNRDVGVSRYVTRRPLLVGQGPKKLHIGGCG